MELIVGIIWFVQSEITAESSHELKTLLMNILRFYEVFKEGFVDIDEALEF